MIYQTTYNIMTVEGPQQAIIHPINELLPDGTYLAPGIYNLSIGDVGMGTIRFNEDKTEWEYDGLDAFTHEEAAELADFIRNYNDPEGADPALLG